MVLNVSIIWNSKVINIPDVHEIMVYNNSDKLVTHLDYRMLKYRDITFSHVKNYEVRYITFNMEKRLNIFIEE